MQHKNFENTDILLTAIAEVIKEQREMLGKSQRVLADEFAIPKSLLSRLENANNEAKIISLWAISQALGIKMSDFIILVEKKLPKDFSLLDI